MPKSHYTKTEEVIKQKYFNHINELYKIRSIELCYLKKAMEKYEEQTGNFDSSYSYYKAMWKRVFSYCDPLDIYKKDHRYVCNKERLDAIDFNIIDDFINKLSIEDKKEVINKLSIEDKKEDENLIHF